MNEKGALAMADGFEQAPVQLRERVEQAFAALNQSGASIASAIQSLREVASDTEKWIPL